jgi:transketolase|tara:strand:+ start:2378 stop:3214 length:837 start_codon:yes stop_codon:yes gene_type:complete
MDRIEKLQRIANYARYLIIETLINSGLGHPGGSLSSIDVMTALYFEIMRIDSRKPDDDERDRFILSKGHSSLGLYTILHLKGFLSKDQLRTFRKDGSELWGHIDIKTPGIEMSAGSLGHGLSVGVGRALAGKIDKKDYRIFVMMGDGETQEGSIWEAAMSAAHYNLDNLIGIVDKNRIQQCGFTEDILALGKYKEKWDSFGWSVKEIDGHDMNDIVDTIKKTPFSNEKPSMIISNTVKGKGISFMENDNKWHGGGSIAEYADQAKKEVEQYAQYQDLV